MAFTAGASVAGSPGFSATGRLCPDFRNGTVRSVKRKWLRRLS